MSCRDKRVGGIYKEHQACIRKRKEKKIGFIKVKAVFRLKGLEPLIAVHQKRNNVEYISK